MPHLPSVRTEGLQQPARTDARSRPEGELSLRDLFAIVRRRAWLVATCVVVFGVLAAIFALLSPHRYSSVATIEVAQSPSRDSSVDELSGALGGLSTPELLNTELMTEQSKITSETVALDVIDRLKLTDAAPFALPADLKAGDPLYAERSLPLQDAPLRRARVLRLFDANLQVAIVKGTRLMTVTYNDTDPVRGTKIANAVVDAFRDETAKSRMGTTEELSAGLSSQLATLKQNVEQSQRRVEQFQAQSGLVGITGEAPGKNETAAPSPSVSVPVSRLVELNEQLTKAQLSRIAMEAIYRTTLAKNPEADLGIPSSSLTTGAGAESSLAAGANGLAMLQQLRAQQSQLHVQIANAAARYGPKSSTMVDLQNRDAALTSQLGTELERISTLAKSDLNLARMTESGIERQVNQQESDVSQWSSKADHLMLLEGEAAASRQLYQDMYAKLQEANLAGGMKGSSVVVIDPARVPAEPSSPKRKQDVAEGMFAGLVFGMIGAFALDFFDDTLHGRHEAEMVLGGPVLGTVPGQGAGQLPTYSPRVLEAAASDSSRSATADSPGSVLVAEPRSPEAEAYRTLRTAVLANEVVSHSRVLAVTSGLPLEDKAITAYNLAISLASLQRRVILIDADMHRRPAQGAAVAGLSELLTGKAGLAQVLRPVPDVGGLQVVTAGQSPDAPADLLDSPAFTGLVRQLQSEYDHVLLDCPPALSFTDATVLARLAGSYLVIARAGTTSRQELQQTLDVLGHTGADLLGVVMTNVASPASSSSRNGY